MIAELFRNLCLTFGIWGIFFIVIELRARLDRSFLHFGISTLLLSIFTVIDGYLIPSWPSYRPVLIRFQHVLVVVLVPFLYTYIFILSNTFSANKLRIIVLLSFPFLLLFLSDAIFSERDNTLIISSVYPIIMLPVYLAVFSHIVAYIIQQINATAPSARKTVLQYHVVAIGLLFLFGLLDILSLVSIIPDVYPNYTIFGLLSFLVITTVVFVYRLVDLVNENRVLIDQIKRAYKELEQAGALKELGKSAAIVTHEIKNQLFIITCNAELIAKKCATLDEYARERLRKIIDTSVNLNDFSRDILDLSRAHIIDTSRKINLHSVVRKCIDIRSSVKNCTLELLPQSGDFMIYGDWDKLLHVFDNLFNNAQEAGATKIAVCFQPNSLVYVVSVTDNGCGVPPSFLSKMFKAFETTKEKSGGTGLGLSIVKSIVESHGGHINAYNRSSFDPAGHGLIINITFPRYEPDVELTRLGQGHNLILIKEGINDLALVVAILNNVYCFPNLLRSVADLDAVINPERQTIIASASVSPELLRKADRFERIHFLIESEKGGICEVFNARNPRSCRPFSEEFVLSLLNRAEP